MSDFQVKLDEILKRGPSGLTDADRDFLSARREYLTPSQLVDFGLVEPSASDSDGGTAEGEHVEAPVRKGRKAKASDTAGDSEDAE
jgi:hypothetical protein